MPQILSSRISLDTCYPVLFYDYHTVKHGWGFYYGLAPFLLFYRRIHILTVRQGEKLVSFAHYTDRSAGEDGSIILMFSSPPSNHPREVGGGIRAVWGQFDHRIRVIQGGGEVSQTVGKELNNMGAPGNVWNFLTWGEKVPNVLYIRNTQSIARSALLNSERLRQHFFSWAIEYIFSFPSF